VARVHVDAGGVPELFCLLVQSFVDLGVAVAHTHGHNAAEQVQVALAAHVPQPLAVALRYHDRLFVVQGQAFGEVLAAPRQALFRRGSFVLVRRE